MRSVTFFSAGLLIIGALTQVHGYWEGNKSGMESLITGVVANRLVIELENIVTKCNNKFLQKIEKQLTSLKKHTDSCSVQKTTKLEALKAQSSAYQCLDLNKKLDQITQILSNATAVSLALTGEVGKVVSNLSTCITTTPSLITCLTGSLGDLEDDLQTLIPYISTFLQQTTSTVIVTAQDIIGCIDHKPKEKLLQQILTGHC